MNWGITLLTILFCQFLSINTLRPPQNYDIIYPDSKDQMNNLRKTPAENHDIDPYQKEIRSSFVGNQHFRSNIKRAVDSNDKIKKVEQKEKQNFDESSDILFQDAQKAFDKLLPQQQYKFVEKNILKVLANEFQSQPIHVYSSSEEQLRGDKSNKHNERKERENKNLNNFISFMLFTGLIISFIYCVYLLLIGCTSTSSTYVVPDSTINRGPTTVYPGAPPTYNSIVNNPPK
uniref:Transmembrane protein n=1 Tax=Strongyloides stercoralis TaxID=6248 RepID=A0A0K0E6I8_STRER